MLENRSSLLQNQIQACGGTWANPDGVGPESTQKHPKTHVGSIFNSGGLVRHQDFWIILP